MRQLKHPNVVRVLGLSIMPPNVCVVLPFYRGGTLKELLDRQRALRGRTSITVSSSSIVVGPSMNRSLLSPESDNDAIENSQTSTCAQCRRILALYFCPCAVHCLHCCCRRCGRKKRREELAQAWTAFEPTEGTRETLLCWNRRLQMAKELTSALAYLHSRNPPIMHRDIKPANILIDEAMHLKLADFGESSLFDSVDPSDNERSGEERTSTRTLSSGDSTLSSIASSVANFFGVTSWERESVVEEGTTVTKTSAADEDGDEGSRSKSAAFVSVERGGSASISSVLSSLPLTIRGSPLWMAPEILRGKHGQAMYGCAADVYSTSIVIWQILSLEKLYDKIPLFHVLRDVETSSLRPSIPPSWSPKLRDVLVRAWHDNFLSRPKASEFDSTLDEIMQSEGTEDTKIHASDEKEKEEEDARGSTKRGDSPQ
eukprot:g2033.t1